MPFLNRVQRNMVATVESKELVVQHIEQEVRINASPVPLHRTSPTRLTSAVILCWD